MLRVQLWIAPILAAAVAVQIEVAAETAKARVGAPTYEGHKMWSVATAWFDYDNDGKLDLFVSNYCQWGANKDPQCLSGGRLRAYCHPRFYQPLPSTLYRNNGDGTSADC